MSVAPVSNDAIQTADDTDEARPATQEEVELHEWGEATRRRTPDVLMESLRQFVTLAAAILVGTAALFDHIKVDAWFKNTFFIIVLAVLAVALFGAYPITAAFLDLEEIKDARDGAIRRRSRCLAFASWMLLVAFALLLGGLLKKLMMS